MYRRYVVTVYVCDTGYSLLLYEYHHVHARLYLLKFVLLHPIYPQYGKVRHLLRAGSRTYPARTPFLVSYTIRIHQKYTYKMHYTLCILHIVSIISFTCSRALHQHTRISFPKNKSAITIFR
jgi:hypothetical protein